MALVRQFTYVSVILRNNVCKLCHILNDSYNLFLPKVTQAHSQNIPLINDNSWIAKMTLILYPFILCHLVIRTSSFGRRDLFFARFDERAKKLSYKKWNDFLRRSAKMRMYRDKIYVGNANKWNVVSCGVLEETTCRSIYGQSLEITSYDTHATYKICSVSVWVRICRVFHLFVFLRGEICFAYESNAGKTDKTERGWK